jgi:hypothetical protein
MLDFACMGRNMHCIDKNTLMMIHVLLTKSNFVEDKVHLFVGSI